MFQIISPQHPAWLTFINSLPEATIFHHPAWLKNLREVYGYRDWIVVNTEGENVLAGIPVMEVKNLTGTSRLISLPFSDYCTPLASSPAALDSLTTSLVEWSRETNMAVEVRWRLPERLGMTTSCDYVLHTTELDWDADVVFERIHRKVRKYIRSSANRGVQVQQGTSREFLQRFYRHHLLTRRRHGLPAQPWKYFEYLGKNILEKGLGFILLAYLGDDCLAGLVALHWGSTLTLKYGASNDDYLRDLRPNHLLDWTAIRWGCEHGYKILDVGRSDINQEGLRDYKNRWGYKEELLHYSYIGHRPSIKTTQGLVGRVFRGVMRHSPLWFCRLAGDILYSHFP